MYWNSVWAESRQNDEIVVMIGFSQFESGIFNNLFPVTALLRRFIIRKIARRLRDSDDRRIDLVKLRLSGPDITGSVGSKSDHCNRCLGVRTLPCCKGLSDGPRGMIVR